MAVCFRVFETALSSGVFLRSVVKPGCFSHGGGSWIEVGGVLGFDMVGIQSAPPTKAPDICSKGLSGITQLPMCL